MMLNTMKEKILAVLAILGTAAGVALVASIAALPLALPVALALGTTDLIFASICFFAAVSFGLLLISILAREIF